MHSVAHNWASSITLKQRRSVKKYSQKDRPPKSVLWKKIVKCRGGGLLLCPWFLAFWLHYLIQHLRERERGGGIVNSTLGCNIRKLWVFCLGTWKSSIGVTGHIISTVFFPLISQWQNLGPFKQHRKKSEKVPLHCDCWYWWCCMYTGCLNSSTNIEVLLLENFSLI